MQDQAEPKAFLRIDSDAAAPTPAVRMTGDERHPLAWAIERGDVVPGDVRHVPWRFRQACMFNKWSPVEHDPDFAITAEAYDEGMAHESIY